MKFTRANLIDGIDSALAVDAAARAEKAAIVARVTRERDAQWDTLAPKWKAYRDNLTKVLKSGKPITSSTQPKMPAHFDDSSYTLGRTIDDATKHLRGRFTDREELSALKLALESVDEEFVTERQLSIMGFGGNAVAKIFRAATKVKGA